LLNQRCKPKIEKSAKNGRKVKATALLFCCFLPLSKIEKSAKNGRKVKAIFLRQIQKRLSN
jgi:hypothetical protein